MPSQTEHEEHCKANLGKPWSEVHKWLDHYFLLVPTATHRIVLHHQLGIELGVKEFGEEVREALELHIRDDFGRIMPGPFEVAVIFYDRGYDILPAQPLLNKLWPGKFNLWDID